MKRWKIIRDTLGFFGISKQEAKAKDIKVVSIDDDITVHYSTNDNTEFSANMVTGNPSINDDVLISGVTGEILFVDASGQTIGDSVTLASGDTMLVYLVDEESNDFGTDSSKYTVTSSNTKVTVSKGSHRIQINAISDGQATITVKMVSDASVVSKLKVYVKN